MHKNDGLLFLSPGFSGGSLSGVRILGLAADGYACGNYRVNYPLQVAAFHGASVRIRNVSICPVTMEEVLEADIIYCQRFTDPNLCKMFADVQKAKGTKLIYDLDDALTCVPPSSPAFDDYSTNTKKGREHLAGIEGFLEAADTVVFSTRELQAVYSKYRHKSYVVPNGLDIKLSARDWTTGKTEWHAEAQKQGFTPEADSVLVGVAGGKTHFHDWKLLASSLERITKESAAFIGIQADPAVVEELLSGYWNNVRDRVVVFKPETYETILLR